MDKFNSKNYRIYANFLNKLAKDLTSFYYSKLNKTFKVSNKLKGKGYDPVTSSDKAFEKFIRSKIKKNFQTIKLLVRSLVTKSLRVILHGLLILLMVQDHLS